jgi:hypothetical protein
MVLYAVARLEEPMVRTIVSFIATLALCTSALAQDTSADAPAPDAAEAPPTDAASAEPDAADAPAAETTEDEPTDAPAEGDPAESETAAASASADAPAEAEAAEGDPAADEAQDGAAGSDIGDKQAAEAAAAEAAKAMTLEEAKNVIAAYEAEEAAKKAAAEAERKKGLWWDRKLSVGATALGLFNRNFVGQADGIGLQLGAIASGEFTLGFKGVIWTSNFDLAESLVMTPNEQNFLAPIVGKAADRLQGQTEVRYQYPGFSYVGPFARAQVQAVVLPSWVLRQDTTRVVKNNIDADPTSFVIGPNLPIGTSGWFEPLIFSETVGVLVEPPSWKTWIESLFRVSAAAQHQLAWGGHVPDDNPDTPELELRQVAVVNSAGVQAEAEVGGTIVERVTYGLKGVVFYPVLAVGPGVEDISLIERTHIDVEARTSLRLAEWLSVDGVVLVRRQPFVINDWQLQTSLLLTSSYSLF